MYKEAIFHDMSKFRPSEFIPYARYFHGEKTEESKQAFDKAWELHYKRNKHHPEHWNGEEMSYKAVMEMICDLKAMSRKFGGTAQEYYLDNYFKWSLYKWSRHCLEINLGLLELSNHPFCEGNIEYWMTLGELYEGKYDLNDILQKSCDSLGLDLNEIMAKVYKNKR